MSEYDTTQNEPSNSALKFLLEQFLIVQRIKNAMLAIAAYYSEQCFDYTLLHPINMSRRALSSNVHSLVPNNKLTAPTTAQLMVQSISI